MKAAHFLVFLVLGLIGLPILGHAADETASPAKESEPVTMKEVVVTATRYEEEILNVPAHVTVITREDMENSTAKDVAALLRTEVGVHVTDVSGNRRNYKVDLRGFGETAQSNTLVLVDGRRVNQADLSGTDWTLIPLDRVERIEIIRGSRGSVLYGDNAAGGVINIITKEGELFRAGIEGAFGSYDATSTSAYLSGSQNHFSYALSGSLYDSDGYRANSELYTEDAGLNLAYMFAETLRVALSSGYHKDEVGLPGALKQSELAAGISRRATQFPNDFADVEDHYVKLRPELFFLTDSLFQIDLSYRERNSFAFASFSGGSFRGDTQIDTTIASPQFVIKEPVAGFRNHLTFGLDHVKAEEDIVNTLLFMGVPSVGIFTLEKKNYGYYVHDEFYPLQRLVLSAGYRHDKVEYGFSPSVPDKTEFDEDLITAGLDYNVYGDSHIYFSFSEGFRYPVLDELFNFQSNTIDTTLVPQTSDNYELGVRHGFSEQVYGNLNLFRIDTKHEIFFNPTGGPFGFGANENLDGETRRQGVEVSLAYNQKKLRLKGTYAYTDTEIRGGQFSGKEVPGVPKHQASLEALYYPRDGIALALNGTYVGKRFFESDFANAFARQDDYMVLNAKIKVTRKKFTLFLDLNNLLDKEYAEFGVLSLAAPVEPAFYPSPEANFLFGIRYDH